MIFDPLIFDSTIFDTGEAGPNLLARRRRTRAKKYSAPDGRTDWTRKN